MMNSITTKLQLRKIQFLILSALGSLAGLTARLGAGTASSWGNYQPKLPDELKR